MSIEEALAKVVQDGTPADIGEDDFAVVLTATAQSLGKAIELPVNDHRPVMAMDMMIARMDAPQVASVSLANLFRQADPTNPRYVKDAILAGGATNGLPLGQASTMLAFFVAVMVLAARSVPRPEAMTLHLAWKIARPDGKFTLDDVMAHANKLRDDYEVDKVSDTDILNYLNNLTRCGSLRQHPDGYSVVERIHIIPL